MSTYQIVILIAGLLVAWAIGQALPISDDYKTAARRLQRIVAALVWMTMFTTWYMQGIVNEVAKQSRIDDYDNCVDDNHIAEGEIERRQRALDEAQSELDSLVDEGSFDIDDLPVDIGLLDDPDMRDLLTLLAQQSESDHRTDVENARIDRDRLRDGLEQYKIENPLDDCGEDPR